MFEKLMFSCVCGRGSFFTFVFVQVCVSLRERIPTEYFDGVGV